MKVVVTDRCAPEALQLLRSTENLQVQVSATPQPSADELSGAVAMLIRSRTRIDSPLLQMAPSLRCVVSATSGFDHIDLTALVGRKDIAIMHTPDANSTSAAELTWALVLACARRLPETRAAVESGTWQRERMVGLELAGLTYGIVGFGRIGRKVAKMAQGFGMQVLAYDPYLDADAMASVTRAQQLQDLLRASDVMSFHVPKTAQTEKMLNAETIALVRPTAILVNTSRGSVWDEAAVRARLKAGELRSVGLDVFTDEPLPKDSPWLDLPHAVLTPHIGATTQAAFLRSSLAAAQKLIEFLRHGTASDVLPPSAAWY